MKYEHTLGAVIAAIPWMGYSFLSWQFESTVLIYCFLILMTVLNIDTEVSE